jgi:hypothetical protein
MLDKLMAVELILPNTGDGLDDLIIGATGVNNDTGRSYVVFGKINTTAINLSSIAGGTGGFSINGEQNGSSVSTAGDVIPHKIYLLGGCPDPKHHNQEHQ